MGLPRCSWRDSASGVILPLGVVLEIGAIEVDLAQIARAVSLRLIVEMRGGRIAALTACGHGLCVDFVAELNDRDEAVSAGAVPLLRAGIRASSERGKGAPQR